MRGVTVVGDLLLDRDVEGSVTRLTPDGPAQVLDEQEIRSRPGGAGLAAVLAAADGVEVGLVTAVGADAAGREAVALLERAGVEVVDLGLAAATPEKIRLRSGGRSLLRWDRGGPTGPDRIGPLSDEARVRLEAADAILVSCYGRGVAARDDVRAAVGSAAARRPTVWDPHPRGRAPVEGCTIATPNQQEAAAFTGAATGDLDAVARAADGLLRRWGTQAVVVTRGAAGALLSTGSGLPMVVPAPTVRVGDACGAGDRFASSVTTSLAAGALTSEAVGAAGAAAARFVGDGGGASVRFDDTADDRGGATSGRHDVVAEVERVRARGGTVVATGGCFDLVHAGHVRLLEAARGLGDHLVVCVNSDASVRRLKGPGRPVVPERDRVELLRALACVDAVVVFDEDTPVEVLRRLRPDVFAKGGDYGDRWIPEADVVTSWGGRAVTLPYLRDRSTTRLLEEVRAREPT